MFETQGHPHDHEAIASSHNRELDAAGREIIRLDARFPLFLPDRTTNHRDPEGDYPEIARDESTVMLDTEGLLPRIPMAFATWGVWKTKGFSIVPFEPEIGYQVDMDDYSTVSRQKKMQQRLDSEELKQHPLMLVAHDSTEMMEESGVTLGNEEYFFRPDVWSAVRSLRFNVDFPSGMRLESRPERRKLREGRILFDRFYPVDSGPMPPTVLMPDFHSDGLMVAVPSDRHALEQIRGSFRLEQRDYDRLRH